MFKFHWSLFHYIGVWMRIFCCFLIYFWDIAHNKEVRKNTLYKYHIRLYYVVYFTSEMEATPKLSPLFPWRSWGVEEVTKMMWSTSCLADAAQSTETILQLNYLQYYIAASVALRRSDLFTSNLRSDHLLMNSAFYSQIVFHFLLVIYKQLHQCSDDIHNVLCKHFGSIFLSLLCYIMSRIPLYCRLFFKTQNTRKLKTWEKMFQIRC